MGSLTVLSSSSPWVSCGGRRQTSTPSASLTFLAGSTRRSSASLNAGNGPTSASGLLHCSFIPTSSSFSSSLSFPSSFSGNFTTTVNMYVSKFRTLFCYLGILAYGFYFFPPSMIFWVVNAMDNGLFKYGVGLYFI
jgi:hypothetical protein